MDYPLLKVAIEEFHVNRCLLSHYHRMSDRAYGLLLKAHAYAVL